MSAEDPECGSKDAYRLALSSTVAALCQECGFEATDRLALESLVEMLQSFLSQLGRSTKHYAELCSRTEASVMDVSLSLVEMGVPIEPLKEYAGRRSAKNALFAAPVKAKSTTVFKTLQVGTREQLPSFIPDYMPPLPDRHAYIQTPARKAPVADYQTVRELAANQKRDVENALTRLIAKTGDSQKLCPDESGGGALNAAFPLIACKPCAVPYLSALLPRDDELSSYDVRSSTGGGGSTCDEPAGKADEADAAMLAKRRRLEVAAAAIAAVTAGSSGGSNEVTYDGVVREFDDEGQCSTDVTDNPYARPPVVAS